MALALVHVIALIAGFCIACNAEHEAHSPLHLTPAERKMLQECNSSNFTTYLKCLKRPKRHHEFTTILKNCTEDCSRDNCITPKCNIDCYTGCKKKTIEIYESLKITEYENPPPHHFPGGHAVPNITTNVVIKNSLLGNDSLFHNISKLLQPKIEINMVINNDKNDAKDSPNKCSCPGCNCQSQSPWSYQMMGYGSGPMANCFFPMTWPCLQFMPVQTNNIDCSQCSNPFMRYQCHVSCYPVNDGSNSSKPFNASATIIIDKSKCKSPNCVGGT